MSGNIHLQNMGHGIPTSKKIKQRYLVSPTDAGIAGCHKS